MLAAGGLGKRSAILRERGVSRFSPRRRWSGLNVGFMISIRTEWTSGSKLWVKISFARGGKELAASYLLQQGPAYGFPRGEPFVKPAADAGFRRSSIEGLASIRFFPISTG